MNAIEINSYITLPLSELEFSAIRAQGAGGQNVNKVSSAFHLKFNIAQSSLPEHVKQKLLASSDSRISKQGVLTIKAQEFRTQEKNRSAAIERLKDIILQACKFQKARRPTKPTKSSKIKRVDKKTQRGSLKQTRKKVDF